MSQLKLTEAGVQYVAKFISDVMLDVFPDYIEFLSREAGVAEAVIKKAIKYQLQQYIDGEAIDIDHISELAVKPSGAIKAFYICSTLDVPDGLVQINRDALGDYCAGKKIKVPDYYFPGDYARPTLMARPIEYGKPRTVLVDWTNLHVYIYTDLLELSPKHYKLT